MEQEDILDSFIESVIRNKRKKVGGERGALKFFCIGLQVKKGVERGEGGLRVIYDFGGIGKERLEKMCIHTGTDMRFG